MEDNATPRIVVGFDGSPPSHRALRWAAAEATQRGVRLDVVHAWTAPYPLSTNEVFRDPSTFEQSARNFLDRAVSSIASDDPACDVHPVLVNDNAASALLQVAEGAELLVVGSRGHGGFTGLLLGSVSQHCVHHARCPVVVIPPAWSAVGHSRIVVGVDDSEPSYAALHWAIAAAGRRGARLEIINAFDYPQPVTPIGPLATFDFDGQEMASRQALRRMVEPALGSAVVRPATVDLLVVADRAARALIEAAHGADLLVVGSRGRGGFHGLLLGSTSQQCVHHAPCPVVVVRPMANREARTSSPNDVRRIESRRESVQRSQLERARATSTG
jgi:nucleotide-binding universal stress UspA family protein